MTLLQIGITPAHAGKSPVSRYLMIPQEDHPRTRGEKTGALGLMIFGIGSPPHTRGKVPSQA